MVIKIKSERGGDHVHQQVFMGPDKDHLAKCGDLCMRIGEWQIFGAALLVAAEKMKSHFKGSEMAAGSTKPDHVPLEVILEGEEQVVNWPGEDEENDAT